MKLRHGSNLIMFSCKELMFTSVKTSIQLHAPICIGWNAKHSNADIFQYHLKGRLT
jgi:hypothetical protein